MQYEACKEVSVRRIVIVRIWKKNYSDIILFLRKAGNKMEDARRPIAVFDSGVGGVSVLRALVNLMPNENYIYFGDSANAPYGPKTLKEVRELTEMHVTHLLEAGAKAVVVACNTATSADIDRKSTRLNSSHQQ